ncbi:hypothetical protein HPHPP2B_0327 [Helicobacter pylori Hp P-2b]|nr:hypothetical protein HPHPP2B_0327 [Helicobacter pylori Hp P-2b]EMG88242.1 hypothetical protein HMPREF1395_00974 [Helicobacter pylori GAM112Ai]EMH31996.1 hypothetical protein HMPREF1424_01385 [Helicobacter pylori GAM42Ai]EMH47584.1 hypothetical protein HMPREF1437_00773 [Helicobacter pylori HP116Bi]
MRIGGYFEIILSIIPLTLKKRIIKKLSLVKNQALCYFIFKKCP